MNLGNVKIVNSVNPQTLVHVCSTGFEKSSLKIQAVLPLYKSVLQHLAFLDFPLLSTGGKNLLYPVYISNSFSNLF